MYGRDDKPVGSALLWTLLLVLVGCGDTAQNPGVASAAGSGDLVAAVQSGIRVESMDVELDSIVQYDRLSGSAGENAAVDYLYRTLTEEGIEARVDTILAFVSNPVSASVEVPGTAFAPEAITVSGSGTIMDLEAPVVDLGSLGDLPPFLTETGERLVLVQDLLGAPSRLDAEGESGAYPDLQGRIALVTGQPRPGPVVQIAGMGAAGVVFVNPEERLNDLTTTSVWGAPSLRSYHRIPTLPVAQIKRSAGDRLRAMMGEGPLEVRMSVETDTGWKELHMVVARVPAPDPDAPYVLAGGHLDSWHHGGTDNAGANVAMLELTRAFHGNRAGLKRGLVTAWWPGHSNGRYAGSTWFVDRMFDDLRRNALAYVNFEGLGQIDAKAFGATATASLSGLAQTVVRLEVGADIRTRPPGRNSDQSFNGVGLPLLQLNHSRLAEDGGYWWWHTPDDTRDKVSAEILKTDTDLYGAALGRLLADPVFPVDLSATVERLGALLRDRQETAGEHLDLSLALHRQEALRELIAEIQRALPPEGRPDVDRALIAVLRPLHRVLYTLQGPYHPDPAVDQGALPGLNAVEILASRDPSSDAYQFALATLLRERARILEALDQARMGAERLVGILG